jgi:N-carbamoyl-D-amino-acid hydrolase
MTRIITVGAAQLGPVQRDHTRADVVERLLLLLRDAATRGCDLVAFPELALTTFFPRWYTEVDSEIDAFYEHDMPNAVTQPLFDEARRLGIGFTLGYAEIVPADRSPDKRKHRYNTQIMVERDGTIVGRYRKVHIPGHEKHEPWRPFQHLERYYFESGPGGFEVYRAFDGIVGMATCNDRRWPETYRVMGLQGVELITIGYNTPIHYAPDPGQNALQLFHNDLCMAGGAYQNGTWVVGVAKGGTEEGVESLAQSAIFSPSGQVVARALTNGDELIAAACDLDLCANFKHTLFQMDRYREPQHYSIITSQKGVVEPPLEPNFTPLNKRRATS